MGQLNELQIKAAAPRDKEYLLADGEGLYLRVRPTGKVWVYRYKQHGGTTWNNARQPGNSPTFVDFERKNECAVFVSCLDSPCPDMHGVENAQRNDHQIAAMPSRMRNLVGAARFRHAGSHQKAVCS